MKLLLILLDLLLVAFFFREDAAAIFLHIHSQLPRLILAFAEAGSKIEVTEFYAVFGGGLLADLGDQFVVLVGGDGEGGGECLKALLLGGAGGLLKAQGIAIAAPMRNIMADRLGELLEPIFIPNDEGQADLLGVSDEGIPAGLILLIEVDIGVIPKAGGGDALFLELLQAGHRAGGAADMQKQFIHGDHPFLRSFYHK